MKINFSILFVFCFEGVITLKQTVFASRRRNKN